MTTTATDHELNDVEVTDRTHETTLVLANAGELAAALLREISGNDIASSIEGSSLTRDMIRNITYRTIANEAKPTGTL